MKITINNITSDLQDIKFDWCANIDDERSFVDQLYSEFINATCGAVGLNNHAVEHKCMLLMFVHFLKQRNLCHIHNLRDCVYESKSKLQSEIKFSAEQNNDEFLMAISKVNFDAAWTYEHNHDFLKAMFCYAGLLPDNKAPKYIQKPVFQKPRTETVDYKGCKPIAFFDCEDLF